MTTSMPGQAGPRCKKAPTATAAISPGSFFSFFFHFATQLSSIEHGAPGRGVTIHYIIHHLLLHLNLLYIFTFNCFLFNQSRHFHFPLISRSPSKSLFINSSFDPIWIINLNNCELSSHHKVQLGLK